MVKVVKQLPKHLYKKAANKTWVFKR